MLTDVEIAQIKAFEDAHDVPRVVLARDDALLVHDLVHRGYLYATRHRRPLIGVTEQGRAAL